jgi:hypothetical protein
VVDQSPSTVTYTPSSTSSDVTTTFVGYSDQNFTNYGTDRLSGTDSFQNTQATRTSLSTHFTGTVETRRATRTISSITPPATWWTRASTPMAPGYQRLRCVLQVRRRLVSRPTHLFLFLFLSTFPLSLSLSLSVSISVCP